MRKALQKKLIWLLFFCMAFSKKMVKRMSFGQENKELSDEEIKAFREMFLTFRVICGIAGIFTISFALAAMNDEGEEWKHLDMKFKSNRLYVASAVLFCIALGPSIFQGGV